MLYFYGFSMTRGILQEKSNRIMEVLLGSMTPDQLMSGKILGIGLVGLTQLAVYLVTAGVLRLYFAGAALSADSDMAGVLDAFTLGKLGWVMLFFLLGYFFFTGLFAAVGAVCNTLPDLDVFFAHGDPVRDFTFHRAETHALFWLTLAAPAIAWLVARVNRGVNASYRE